MTKYDRKMQEYGMILMHKDGHSFKEIAHAFGVHILRVRTLLDPDHAAKHREAHKARAIKQAFLARQKQSEIATKKIQQKQAQGDLSTETGVSASGIPYVRKWVYANEAAPAVKVTYARKIPLSLPRVSILEAAI